MVAVIAGGLDRYLMAKGDFGCSVRCGGEELNQAINGKQRRRERQLRLHACSFVNLRGAVSS